MKIRQTILLTGLLAILAIGCGNSSDNVVQNNTQQSSNQVSPPKAVYTMTNDTINNEIRSFVRDGNGNLTFQGSFSTGGTGSGDNLNGASNSLVFEPSTNRFYCVNAGSNSISALILGGDGTLTVLSTVSSGGIRPVSLAVANGVVYVLNFGDANNAPNITGFRLNGNQLQPINGSTRTLAANSQPAQIQFTPSATILVVTQRATNQILTWVLNADLTPAPAKTKVSSGLTPFGFDFTPGGVLVVSEAGGGGAGAGSLSTYSVGVDGTVTDISRAVPNGQSGSCWVAVNRNNPFAFCTNTGSNNVSGYNIDAAGQATLLAGGVSAATGAGPFDARFADDQRFLYVLNINDDSISGYSMDSNGALTPTTVGVTGLPPGSIGLVAR